MKSLNFIHIGKCGGSSLRSILSTSPIILQKYDSIRVTHVSRPVYAINDDYLIVVRDPLVRAISAFRWRYRLVVSEGSQRDRFPGEYTILSHQRSFGRMAELLYCDGRLDNAIASELLCIHHLKENISFYLTDLLNRLQKNQVLGVISQETLSEDSERILGIRVTHRLNYNGGSDVLELSETARLNAFRFLADDYKCIYRLYCLGCLSDAAYKRYFAEGMGAPTNLFDLSC